MLVRGSIMVKKEKIWTKCGKYSFGPLCNHFLVESVGAFCSFASGCDAVINHSTRYISTHPFVSPHIKLPDDNGEWICNYDDFKDYPWYFDGVKPHGIVDKLKRSVIGNDVWLGKNVILCNGINIGDGSIAVAGAVVVKDIPAYAIVGGVPAKIIKYRYTKEQILALRNIAWWNWDDEKIRRCHEDFYLPIEDFLRKHKI